MLLELINFEFLEEFSLSYQDFKIVKLLTYHVCHKNVARCRCKRKNGRKLIQIIKIQNLKTDHTQIFKLGLDKESLWQRLGQSIIIWNNNVPLIVWKNYKNRLILYPDSTKTFWRTYRYKCFVRSNRDIKFVGMDSDGPLDLKFVQFDDDFLCLQDDNYCYTLHYDQTLILTRRDQCTAPAPEWDLLHLDNFCFATSFSFGKKSITAKTYIFDGIWNLSPNVVAGTLCLIDNNLHTITGFHGLPEQVLHQGWDNYLRKGLGIGWWYGKYYIYGFAQGHILVPWNIEDVKHMPKKINRLCLTIFCCVKRLALQKYVPTGLWRNIILPLVFT